MERLRSILVFRIGQLGDTLVSLPAISVIRQQHPDHRLVLLTERQPVASGYVSSWDVLGPTGWFDDVIFYVPEQNLGRRVLTMLSLAKRVRALQPAMVYNLAPKRTGRQDRRDRFFFRRLAGVKEYRGGGFFLMPPKNSQDMLPRVEPEWKRLLRVIGAKTGNTNYRLFIPVTEQEHARKLLLREGLGNGTRMLAIGPGSKMTAKMWGRDRYRELGQRLLRVYPELHLAVVGGKEDAAAGEELCAVWGHRSHNLAGRLSVYGSAAALQQCIAYIGNDAGAMHLAGMMGISCVALFSARDYPGQWEPYGTNHVILRHETECAGCMRTVCPYNNKCLSLISIDEAEHALRRVLSSETILERSGRKSAEIADREPVPPTPGKTQPYLSDLVPNITVPGSAPYGSDMGETHNDPVCGENRCSVIYLTNYVGPQVRATRDITTDSAAGSKKSVDLVRAMEVVGAKVVFLSLGWKRATWSLRAYPPMAESVDGRLVCEYAGQWDFPLLNFITNISSVCRLIAERAAEEQATGSSCRLIVYNPSVQMTLAALYARLVVKLPLYLQLEDGTHLIPTVGIFRRTAYFVSHQMLRRLISGVILVSPVIRRGYETVPSVICRGVATQEPSFARHSRLDDPAITSGGGVVTFFFGSTLDEIRGVALLLDALKRADADLSFPAGRAKFIITGRGPLESQVAERCRSLKRLRADFMGFVDLATYQRLLSEAHVAMALQDPRHPYSRACFPSKVIEYMTSGTLVLTTAVADIVEFTDGRAVLVDPLRPEVLVEIWKDVINHPMHYVRIAAAGQKLVLEKCSLERTGLEITSLFK